VNDWRPGSDWRVAARRAALLARVRDYLDAQAVLSVDVPALAPATVTDPMIESIATVDGLFLATSPEFAMKRLLAAGYPDIYSVCRVFRGGESGRRHQREFTMIEWYRLNFGLGAIVDDTLNLVAHALDRPALADSAARHDYAELFVDKVGVDPLTAPLADIIAAADPDPGLRSALGDRRSDWLDLVLATVIAPQLPHDRLTVVRHYPAAQAALARACPADGRVADRFEVFAGTLELANGYVELVDPVEQAERFERDLEERRARGLPKVPVDDRLLAAIGAGLPDCAGVALGFERLHMFAESADDIRAVIPFAEN
jgi:lysyl-tRNA synthetase class 2